MHILTEIFFSKSSPIYKRLYEYDKNVNLLRLKLGQSFLNYLPKTIKRRSAIINDIKFVSGDILVRPVFNIKIKDNNLIHFKHYGIYYGSESSSGAHYIINKEPDGLIYVRTLLDYMNGNELSEIEIIKKPKGTRIADIIKRASIIEEQPYTAFNNNCQHFVNFAVFGSYNSITSDAISSKFTQYYNKIFKKDSK